MSHYNIYSDLGIDPAMSSAEITRILDQRLADTSPSDTAELDRLRTSRQLFADEARRRDYDRALNDPTSPEITIARFREFASGRETAPAPVGAATTAYRWDGAESPAWHQGSGRSGVDMGFFAVTPDRQRSESLMWLIGFGIIVLGWLYLLFTLISAQQEVANSSDIFVGAGAYSAIVTTSVFAVLHTIAMLTILQFLWNLRMYIGRFVR